MLSVFRFLLFFFFFCSFLVNLNCRNADVISSDLWYDIEVYQRALFQEKGITGSHPNS